MSCYTRTVLLLRKSNGISDILLLPMKKNNKLVEISYS